MTDSDLDFLDDEDNAPIDSDKIFCSAAAHVQNIHGNLPTAALLELYALYKQVTVGRCNTAKPGIFQLQLRAKWTAWENLGDMSTDDARKLYIQKVQEFDSSWQPTLDNEDVNKTTKSNTIGWVVHSVLEHQADDDADATKAEHEKTAFDYVKELNLERLRKVLKHAELTELDAHGMALIHWAADRNAIEILNYLIDAGADVNQRDSDAQTPLHYAASCGHLDALRLLLKHRANRTLCDNDGQSSLDVADNDEVRNMLLNEKDI